MEHLPHTPCICILMQLGHMLLATFIYTYIRGQLCVHQHKAQALCRVDGRGYDGQLKYTTDICDAHRLCHSILAY